MNKPKHHIIDTRWQDKYFDNTISPQLTLNFSIDFEPVTFFIGSKKFAKLFEKHWSLEKISFWEEIINFVCDVLNKEKRAIYCYKGSKQLPPFGKTLLEYIQEGTFGRVLYMETKTYHINKLFKWYESYNIQDESYNGGWIKFDELMHESSCGELYDKIRQKEINDSMAGHFHQIEESLKWQGITPRKNFYNINPDMINKLIRQIQKL